MILLVAEFQNTKSKVDCFTKSGAVCVENLQLISIQVYGLSFHYYKSDKINQFNGKLHIIRL